MCSKTGVFALRLILTLKFVLLADFYSQAQIQKWVAPAWADTVHNPFVGSADSPAVGRMLYVKMCAQCHGYMGKGDGPVAFTLRIKPANHSSADVQRQTDGALFWKISEGRGAMAPYKSTLSADQRWRLVNYIRKLRQ